MILTLIWLIPAIPAAIASGIFIYKGPTNPPPFSDQIKGGNKRTATLSGIIFGLGWPLLLALLIISLIAEWFKAGAPDA